MYTAKPKRKKAQPRRWSVAEGRREFAKLITLAGRAPQTIYRRDEPVAVFIGGSTLIEFEAWLAQREKPSLLAAQTPLREAVLEAGIEFEAPARTSRPNPFDDAVEEAS